MSPELLHERLDVYRLYLDVANLCGTVVSSVEIPIVVLDHLDRAMESIGVNLMRAISQVSGPQRLSYLDVSIASAHECAASLDVCFAKHVIDADMRSNGVLKLWRIRGMLIGLKRANVDRVREEPEQYGTPRFPFADLDMYQAALEGVRWTHGLLEELVPRTRTRRKLDVSTTGTVLNIAEGHGRATAADQNRFMKIAQQHAFQTVLLLDLMVARNETTVPRVVGGKATQARVLAMLHAWCAKNDRNEEPRKPVNNYRDDHE